MESVWQWVVGLLVPLLAGVAGGWVGMRIRQESNVMRIAILEQEVKSLRKSRHEHGNHIISCQVDIVNIKHDVERLRDGKNGRH